MAEAFILNASLEIFLSTRKLLLGEPLSLPSGHYVVFAKFDCGLRTSKTSDVDADGWASFRLEAKEAGAYRRRIPIDEDEAAAKIYSNAIEQGEWIDGEQTVVLTLATNLPKGGRIDAFGSGKAVIIREVRITAVQVDNVHVTTFEAPKRRPHFP